MRLEQRSLAVLGLGLAASGCSQLLALELTGSLDRPEVVIVDRDGVDRRLKACVDEIEIRDSEAHTGPAHWSVRAAGERCVRVERVVYGETPAGFIEVAAPQPLVAETQYSLLARGWSGGFASVPWRGGAEVRFGRQGWERTMLASGTSSSTTTP